MNEPAGDDGPRPARRPRYRGPNPRDFAAKYKEHRPDLYADDVARVIAAGKTPAGSHRPILVREVLDALGPRPGDIAVDCTLGHGGHAAEILAAIRPGGRLLAVDADPIELPRAEGRLLALGFGPESVTLRRMSFAGVAQLVAAESPGGADVLLADLGLSSMQVDDPARGFTFKADGPLDMRMNPGKGRPAYDLLARVGPVALARILLENADEPRAVEVAAAILAAQGRSPLLTTRALAAAVRAAGDDAAVRRAFQAIRIVVNDEFAALDALLRSLPACLKPGGRAAILTFHSGEDRRVKLAFQQGYALGHYAAISPEPIRPSPEERRSNPRSTSAKLRTATRSNLATSS